MSKFKYTLPQKWITKVANMEEFKSGGMQVSVKLKNGKFYSKILISNCMWIVAMRGYKDLPFSIDDIVDVYQTDSDKNPKKRSNWDFWDKWPGE